MVDKKVQKHKGWIKYTDPIEGYGYILAEDAEDASETTLFTIDNIAGDVMQMQPGTHVEFEIEEDAQSGFIAKGIDVI